MHLVILLLAALVIFITLTLGVRGDPEKRQLFFLYVAIDLWLAAVFLFTVHYFNCHWRPDKLPQDIVMFTGTMPLEEFRHERAVEYRRLVDSGELERYLVDPPSARLTRGAEILGMTLITIGVVLLALVLTGFVQGLLPG